MKKLKDDKQALKVTGLMNNLEEQLLDIKQQEKRKGK